jgi:hypothetical protein
MELGWVGEENTVLRREIPEMFFERAFGITPP